MAKRPILVVDDEPDILHSLKSLLRPEFEVHAASSGADGIEILQRELIHIVMTDQRMPSMTGVEFLSRIKNEHPIAIRLIFTGYADTRAVIDAINQGNVFRYVAKPWDPDELIEALREAGQQYDKIVERRKLLSDIRKHETEALEFDETLRAGNGGKLTPESAIRLEQLYLSLRSLVLRLDTTLQALERPAP
jgi:DNA-binding NtrC family response regulator